ncbi:PAS domain S-box protein [Spirochaeta africana]|uniref:PAS domain S-box n=1 Tax=Spirochaeta africana (strain ATCC 700263 / DSM 8902 / Z-7692) TaxID=889378 RepID=H9UFN1_SPIAZ|nr:PAS domain S-box protein [Spirochaeta africana]AFG36324.1 PAS domain S-box [Spirochaeta africana DSM 8902]
MPAQYLVGIGASAGGLEALQALLSSVEPRKAGSMAIVIAQHVSPTYKSQLVELLSRQTALPIGEVVDGESPQGGRVYITPPDRDVAFASGRFVLTRPASGHGPRPSVDEFFCSLAENYQAAAAAIVLSGTGSDAAHGVMAIHAAGGLVMVQDPASAKYDGMPAAAIETRAVDVVAEPHVIGSSLWSWLQQGAQAFRVDKAGRSLHTGSAVEHIMQLLSDRTGTDFSRYKPATIGRRLEKRLSSLGIDSIEDYLELLRSSAGELDELFSTILIGVTYFFRDAESFDALREQLEQRLLQIGQAERIRIWVPGCATGEEAYSVAILAADILGDRIGVADIQIFATDLDEKALSVARRGRYPGTALENMPQHLRSSYFIADGDMYEVVPAIRSLVLFSRHDVTSNPPFLKLDLISCRNLLIYFGQELQQHVVPLFHYALKPEGLLFLGKSETIGGFSDLFETLSTRHKVYRRTRGSNPYANRALSFTAHAMPSRRRQIPKKREYTIADMVKDTLYHSFEHPYVVVNNTMEVMEVAGDVRDYLSIKTGAMSSDLITLIDDRYEIELRSLLTAAIRDNTPATGNLRRLPGDDRRMLRFQIKPLLYSGSSDALYLVVFEHLQLDEYSMPGRQEDSGDATMRERELELELAATREHLQNYIEELETSTEELQSLNEELQSTNEELQSSNEELETSNEELQSTNEELQIAYTELKNLNDEAEQQREQLHRSEVNLRAVLENTLQGFLLLDRSYRVVVRNETAAVMLHQLSGAEVTADPLIIDYLPGDEIEMFHHSISRCMQGETVAKTRRMVYADGSEHWLLLQFTPVPVDDDGQIQLISLAVLDITERKESELALSEEKQLNQLILDSAQVGICLTGIEGNFEQVNAGYCSLYGYTAEELVGKPFSMVLPPGMRDYAERLHKRYLQGQTEESSGEWEVLRKDGTRLTVLVGAGRLHKRDGSVYKVTTVVDITAQKQAEEERNRLFTVSLDLMGILRYDGFFQHVNPAWVSTLGYAKDRLLQEPLIELVHTDDRRRTLDFFRALIEKPQTPVSFENRCIAADGTVRWLSWNIAVVPEQRQMYVVARDVTDSRRYQNLLRDTQSVAKVGGWELDTDTEHISWTDEVYHIYDLPAGQPVDYELALSTYEPRDQELIREAIAKAVEYGESSDLEVRFTSHVGRQLWVRVTFKGVAIDGTAGKVIGTIQDITLQKQAELENLRLSLAASRTDNGVVIADHSFRLEWVNHGFEVMTGYKLSEIKARQLDKALLRMGASGKAVRQINQGIATQQSLHEELELRRRNGQECWVRLDITPVLDDDGQLVNWVALVHDITGQKEFQTELIEARNRAEEMNRLKSSFLANMSHEIRTPLNGILGMANIIRRDAGDAGIRDYADLLEQSGQRLLRTINQVLDLSKLEAHQTELFLEPMELNQLVQQVHDSIEPAVQEKQLQLVLKPHPEPLYAEGDSYLVENILLNLLNNAIKFTDEGQVTIRIRTRVVDGSPCAAVEVTDTGIGMSPEYLSRLFVPFSQESTGQARRYEGTGLGLSISREYAVLMDGDIQVESKKGTGSTFRLLLPMADRETGRGEHETRVDS